MLYRLVVCVVLTVFHSFAVAATNHIFEGQDSLVPRIDFFEDSDGRLSLEDVRDPQFNTRWETSRERLINLGYTESPHWFRLSLTNRSEQRADLIFEIKYPMLDSVDYFRVQGNKLLEYIRTGDHEPFSQRAIAHPNFLFPIELSPGESNTIYLRVQTGGSLQLPIYITRNQVFFETSSRESQIHTFYYGMLSVVALLNLFIFMALREKTYLYYALATTSYMLFLASLRATTFEVLWPNNPWLHNQSIIFLIPTAMMLSALFARSFMATAEHSPRIDLILKSIAGLSALSVAGSFVLDYATSTRTSVTMAIPSYLIMLSIGPVLWAKGIRAARYYTVAWGMLTLGAALTAINKYGLIPSNFVTEYGMQIGSALETILLTVALAERLYKEREDKMQAQSATIREHNERRQVELKLIHNALHHPVSSLPNRTCLEMVINDRIKSQRNQPFCLCIIHLLRFKEINKTLGHNNADLVLAEVSKVYHRLASHINNIYELENVVDEHFYLASFESASFGLILNMDNSQELLETIRNLREELLKPIEFKTMRLEMAPAIGLSSYPKHGMDAGTLIRHAHVALEEAETEEFKYAFYRPEQDRYNARRLTIVSELKQAISNEQLVLFFQPKFDLVHHRVTGVEALIRWNHHRFGLIPPDEFIPIAEQTGVIKSLTRWVVKNAIAVQKELSRTSHNLNVAINISALNLRESDFIDFVCSELDKAGMDPGLLTVELTETAMMQDPETSIGALEQLHRHGIKVSLDDFGTGYSSLAYIQSLPVDEIKLDRSLIARLGNQRVDQTIVRSTTKMCHDLGFRVVAEGVENQEVIDILARNECDVIQGFFIAPPLPMEKLIEWLCISHGDTGQASLIPA